MGLYNNVETIRPQDPSVYGKWLMQQGMSAGEVAQMQRAKRLDEERKLAAEAQAESNASQIDIQKQGLDIQRLSAERQDQREGRLLETQNRALQESDNQKALDAAKRGGFANILARDSDSAPVGVAAPEAIQSWLGRVPFEDLGAEEKQIVAGYGEQMGIGINEIPSAYETFRTEYVGALTPEERTLQSQAKAVDANKQKLANLKLRGEIIDEEDYLKDVGGQEDPNPETVVQEESVDVDTTENIISDPGVKAEYDSVLAIRDKYKKPQTVETKVNGVTLNMPIPAPPLANVPAPGAVKAPAAAPQVRTFQPKEVVQLSTEMAKYPSRAEFMKAAGIKTDAEYRALIKQIAAMKAAPIPATTASNLPRG